MKSKKILIKLFLITILFLSVWGCEYYNPNKTDTSNQQGSIPINISLISAQELNYSITRIRVIITKDNYTNSLNLAIQDTTATGIFTNLEIGTYQIEVTVFENEQIIAEGFGEGEVLAGENTIVNITLEFIAITGNLEIQVNWGETIISIPQRVLFIGNSYTYYNGGIYSHVDNMIEESHPEFDFIAEEITFGGYTLENHYNNDETINSIRSGEWDLVILQEQSTRPVDNPELMYQFARLLDFEITSYGGNTGFFMTWAREINPAMIDDLAAAYNYIGQELDAVVSPVGRAFQKAIEEDPLIDLYSGDGSHPSQEGTYLASCVFYSIIMNESPEGILYINNPEVSEIERDFLQEIAWETIEMYRN